MRHRRTHALLGAALVLGGMVLSACKSPDELISGAGAVELAEQHIDGKVLGLLDQKYPGATVAVTKNGRLVWSKGYGYADYPTETLMQPWHRSRIGSVSKLVTAVGALQLVEDGTLHLDQPIYGDPGPYQGPDTPWPPPDPDHWPEPSAVLAQPETYWAAMRDGALDMFGPDPDSLVATPTSVSGEINKLRDWASQVTVRHLLTHTSGLLRSGNGKQVAELYGMEVNDYRDGHRGVLQGAIHVKEHSSAIKCYLGGELYVKKDDPAHTGATYRLPPFLYEPGTDRCYSNHGFGLLGHIVGEASGGPEPHNYAGYLAVVTGGVLDPLGLDGMVPNNTSLDDGLDATPHGTSNGLDPENPASSVGTGGWSATAQDLARIMCGLDRGSNHLRLLAPDTVSTMETKHFPAAGGHPLGWDGRGDAQLSKNGKIGGGASRVMKFLPGRFDADPEAEINVAVMVNGGKVPPKSLLKAIGRAAAEADIPDDYDLFDPAYRCVVDGPTLTIHQPDGGATLPLGAEVDFQAEARDGTGQPLPITWTLPGTEEPVETQPQPDGTHSLSYDGLPPGWSTVVATTVDSGGHQASQQVTVKVTGQPPGTPGPGAGEPGPPAGPPPGPPEPADDPTPEPGRGPTVTIAEPAAGSVHTDPPRGGAVIDFAGSAVDGAGEPIDGMRLRWTASTEGGRETVLCEGTHVPGAAGSEGSGLTIAKSCASFTAELTGHQYGDGIPYLITLEAWDRAGNSGTAQTTIWVVVPVAG